MNFRSQKKREEPEINFIPLIDLLLVILIFLMITTTYNRLNGMQIQLPAANATTSETLNTQDIMLLIKKNGWEVNKKLVTDEAALKSLLQENASEEGWVIIYVDASTPYQKLIDTMQTAQAVGMTRITMATDSHGQALNQQP